MKKEETSEEEVDLETLLEQAKPSVEVAEAGEEKKVAKKPRKKPVAKKTEEKTEKVAEEKKADAE